MREKHCFTVEAHFYAHPTSQDLLCLEGVDVASSNQAFIRRGGYRGISQGDVDALEGLDILDLFWTGPYVHENTSLAQKTATANGRRKDVLEPSPRV